MSSEQRRVANKLRQLRAMCLLSCNLTADLRKDLDRDFARIPEMHKSELVTLEAQIDATVGELVTALGMRKSLDECWAYIDEMARGTGEMPWLQIQGIEADCFSTLPALLQKGNLYPPHTRLG